MADNNVFILFEEIKTALKGINGKLEALPKVAGQQPQIENNEPDLSPIKEAIVETAKAQSGEIKGLLDKHWKAYAQISILILHTLIQSRSRRMNKVCNKSHNRRSISTGIILTSSQARLFLSLWDWVWHVPYPCVAISCNGSPIGSIPMMR